MIKLIIGVAVGLGAYAACRFLHFGPWPVDARIVGAIGLGLVTMARVR